MRIVRTVRELRLWSRDVRRNGPTTVGIVPTMGALHAGHQSLVRAAKSSCQSVAVSIFVNPTQFGPHEDFEQYPRTLGADCAMLDAEGVDVVFAPSVEELYPPESATFVSVEGIESRLDGTSRPGHFRGVATVVAKLLIASEADRAFFGQKDAAQVAVLRRMTADLRLATEIVVCPIVREADGLAISSRNIYLSPVERAQALVLNRALQMVKAQVAEGVRSADQLAETARAVFAAEPSVRVDYVAIVDAGTLVPVEQAVPGVLVAVAAWVGPTRLIDNIIVG